jgi:POT family proton-dependent oligopeptide transporter
VERHSLAGLLALFFLIFLRELFILPTGLGLFARAPPHLGATTVAYGSW